MTSKQRCARGCRSSPSDAEASGKMRIFAVHSRSLMTRLTFLLISNSKGSIMGYMANKTEKNEAKPSGVLVTAATSIGKVAGKIVGLVTRKSGEDTVTKTRRLSRKKVQTSSKKREVSKKTGMSRKTKTVKSSPRKPKT